MRRLRFPLSMLGFALAAIPASATITYTACSSGCTTTGGSYSALQAAPGSASLTFTSAITFLAGGLSGSPAIYTDSTTGTAFSGFSNTTADSLNVSGTALVQTIGGTGTSIQLQPPLPANTYALGLVIGSSAFASPWIELVTSASNLNTTTNAQYQLIIPNSTSPQFFGIVSDTPITSIFIWNSGTGGALNIQSFEIGQEAPTPEAATFFTMGAGLLGLYFWRRLRWRKLFRLRRPIAARTFLGPVLPMS